MEEETYRREINLLLDKADVRVARLIYTYLKALLGML